MLPLSQTSKQAQYNENVGIINEGRLLYMQAHAYDKRLHVNIGMHTAIGTSLVPRLYRD